MLVLVGYSKGQRPIKYIDFLQYQKLEFFFDPIFTSWDQESSLWNCLKIRRHQKLAFFGLVGFYFAKASLDFSTKGSGVVVMMPLPHFFLGELSQPFNPLIQFRSGAI